MKNYWWFSYELLMTNYESLLSDKILLLFLKLLKSMVLWSFIKTRGGFYFMWFNHLVFELFDPDGVIGLSGGLMLRKIRPRWGHSKS
jgi:hypothetical protein